MTFQTFKTSNGQALHGYTPGLDLQTNYSEYLCPPDRRDRDNDDVDTSLRHCRGLEGRSFPYTSVFVPRIPARSHKW